MQDRDGDGRADRLRLRYSKRVRHAADRDGRYPFRVAGYRVRSVAKALGRRIVLRLAEKAIADPDARPHVRYRRTRTGRVVDRARRQAVRQTFRRTRAHGNRAGTGPRLREARPRPIATGTGSKTRGTARRGIRRSIRARRTRPISASSTRTATASTATCGTRSSSRRTARTAIRAPAGSPSARSRPPSRRRSRRARMSTPRQARTTGSRPPPAWASTAATSPGRGRGEPISSPSSPAPPRASSPALRRVSCSSCSRSRERRTR